MTAVSSKVLFPAARGTSDMCRCSNHTLINLLAGKINAGVLGSSLVKKTPKHKKWNQRQFFTVTKATTHTTARKSITMKVTIYIGFPNEDLFQQYITETTINHD